MEPYVIVTDGVPGRVPATLPLSDVLKMQRIAHQLVWERFNGKTEALEMIKHIANVAMRPGGQGWAHAVVSMHLIRAAVEDMAAQKAALQAQMKAQADAQKAAQAQQAQQAQQPKTEVSGVQEEPSGCVVKHPPDMTCEACNPFR